MIYGLERKGLLNELYIRVEGNLEKLKKRRK